MNFFALVSKLGMRFVTASPISPTCESTDSLLALVVVGLLSNWARVLRGIIGRRPLGPPIYN